MTYFRTSDEVTALIEDAVGVLLQSAEGRDAAAAAVAGFADGCAQVEVRTRHPGSVTVIDLAGTVSAASANESAGASGSAGAGGATGAVLEMDADLLHTMMMGTLHTGEIARAYDEERITMNGPPAALQALVRLATPLSKAWQRSAARSPRSSTLQAVEPGRSQIWSAPPIDAEKFVGEVIPARRRRVEARPDPAPRR